MDFNNHADARIFLGLGIKPKPNHIMNTSKLTVAAASLLALVSTASAADMSSVKISGYLVASYQYEKVSGAASTDALFKAPALTNFLSNGDGARINLSASEGKVSGNVSLYYVPNLPAAAGGELGVLDVYVTVALDSGWSVTAGKFYGPFGYEVFDSPGMNAITYGNGLATLIPSNDNIGVRLDYSEKTWSANVSVVDSLYNTVGNTFAINDTDAELKDTKAIDLSMTYKGISDLTLFAAYGYQDKGTAAATASTTKSISLYDVWASYMINSDLVGALEYVYSTNAADSGGFGSQWLATLNYAWDKQISTAFRLGYDVHQAGVAGVNGTQYTIAPAYKVSDHFTVRGEFSHSSISGGAASANFFGLQGVYTF